MSLQVFILYFLINVVFFYNAYRTGAQKRDYLFIGLILLPGWIIYGILVI